METPLAACAPNNDLHLLKILVKYENIYKTISKAASTMLASHIWYLSEELVGLVLFDRNISISMKQKIIQGLTNKGNDDPPKKVQINIQTIHNSELNDFVTSKSKVIFQKLNIPTSFLEKDPEFWKEDDDFQTASTIVHELKVVNDHAERGVALIQKYCRLLIKEEDQLQYLLQVVQQHRKMYPNSSKRLLQDNTNCYSAYIRTLKVLIIN